jgi:hypothetical protein
MAVSGRRVSQRSSHLRVHCWFLCFLALAVGCGRGAAPAREATAAPARDVGGVQGESATYTYDAAGNVLRIQGASAAPVTIASFAPAIGGPGQSVTVTGTGFNPALDQNAVTLNGTPAVVQAATSSSLTFLVPAAATTGLISVTSGGSSAQSATVFTVVHGVVVSDFTPRVGPAGTPLSITGFNFDPVAANDVVRVGAGAASVTGASLTSLQATVQASATPGKVSVTAGGSTGTSDADFFVVPSGYLASNVGYTRRVAFGEDVQVTLPTAGQVGLVIFEGVQGQNLSLYVSGNGFSGSTTVKLFSPSGSSVYTGAANAQPTKIVPPALPSTGTYTVVVQPASNATGSLHLQILPDVTLALPPDGSSQTMTLATGQNGRCTFTAGVGDTLGLGYPSLSTSPAGSVTIWLLMPNGTFWTSATPSGPGSWQLPTFTTAGTYTLTVVPNGTAAASMSLVLTRPLTGTLATDGTPTRFQTQTVGQSGRYTFNGTAGQSFTVRATSTAAFVGGGNVQVLKPDGTQLPNPLSLSSSGITDAKGDLGVLPATGTYSVAVLPAGVSVGTVDLRILPQVTTALVVGDPPKALTVGAGQIGRVTFTASAGDTLGLGYPSLATTPSGSVVFYVYQPNGTAWSGVTATGPGSWQIPKLSMSGTYTMTVTPSGTAAASLSVALTRPLSGTLATDGTPTRFQTSTPGQTGQYTFSGTAGQSFTLRVQSPAAFVGYGTVQVTKPDGTQLGSSLYLSTSGSTDAKIDLRVLPVSGTYTVGVQPQGVSVGTVDLSLIPQITTTLVIGDPPQPMTLANGQNGRATFTASVGDTLGLGYPNLSTNPAGSVTLLLYLPDGTAWTSTTPSGPGSWQLPKITTAGTYTLTVVPNGTAAASMSLVLTRPLSGALAADGPPTRFQTQTMGQTGRYTFSGTAGQSFTVRAQSSAAFVGGGYVQIARPDGTQWAGMPSLSSTGATDAKIDLSLLPVTGSYAVLVLPSGTSVGTVDLTLITQATATLSIGSEPQALTLSAAQSGRYSFAGTAGDLLNLVVPSYSTTPAWSPSSYTVYKPDGSALSGSTLAGPGTFYIPQLPSTGTYWLSIQPGGTSPVSFALQLARR